MTAPPQATVYRRSRRQPTHTEHYLTVVGPAGLPPMQAAAEVFAQLAGVMAELEVEPLQERVYGPAEVRDEVMAARAAALSDHGLCATTPCAYTDGRSGDDRGPVSAQLWGIVRPADSQLSLQSIEGPQRQRGWLLEGPTLRLLWLAGIDGTTDDGRLASGVTGQATEMWSGALAGLREQGFALRDVVRTWISVRRLLDWYGEFNRVRTELFHLHGLRGVPGGQTFPASTGIQGHTAGEECTMELLALQPRGVEVSAQPLSDSARQDRPFSYGSAFSRAMQLDWGGSRTILVSGTASIDADGRTLHPESAEAQVLETLLAIGALIRPHGARLSDVVSGVLYFKNTAAARAYQRVKEHLELPDLPLVPVLADVCRPDLLVEIEAVALVPDSAALATSDRDGHDR